MGLLCSHCLHSVVFIAVFQILVIDQGIKTDKGFILVELIFGLGGANKQL